MTIQEAVQLAVDGGYNTKRTVCAVRYGWAIPEKVSRYNANQYLCEILLDPLFWQALGKGMGWDTEGYYFQQIQEGRYMMRGSNEHTYHWHRLIDHLASGKSIEDFFANLLPHE